MSDKNTPMDNALKEAVLSDFDYAKNLLKIVDSTINARNSSAEEFNGVIETLENCLATKPINFITGLVDDVLEKVRRLRNYDTTRDELVKTVSILRVALTSWIDKEENRRLDIEAFRRVGRLMGENPEAFYRAVFGKRDE